MKKEFTDWLGNHLHEHMESIESFNDGKCRSILYEIVAGLDNILSRIWVKLMMPIYIKLAEHK